MARLHKFLALVNPQAATQVVQTLAATPTSLLKHPRTGEQLYEFEPREVRRLLVGNYEMRYEIQASTIYLLRLWHSRESH